MTNATTLEAPPARETPVRDAAPPGPLARFLAGLLGWVWRLLVGTFLCLNPFGAILVVGWLYRWLQGRVLYGWFSQSKLRHDMSFEAFCATLGPDAPVLRPRWLLRDRFDAEQMRAERRRLTADGEPPGLLRRLARAVLAPFRSLGLNLQTGLLAVLATFLVTGWGSSLMTFSWLFGWENSFHKGYEQFYIGPLTGIAGLLLLAAALVYVPMAQVHQAVTGDFRAFFEFRFVWRLIRARLTSYVLFAALFVDLALGLEILKTLPTGFDDHIPYFINMSDQELLGWFQGYYFGCSFFLLLCLLATRAMAGRIYRSAVLKVLRRGRLRRDELHPRLADWLERLDLFPEVKAVPGPVVRRVRAGVRWLYRRFLFVALFALCVGFVAKTYVGEFFNYHPVVGYLNHPLVQVPCCNYLPPHLQESGRE